MNSTNFLGVTFDNELNWEKHIETISKKIRRNIGVMCKLKNYLPLKSMITMYYSLVYPHLFYCNLVWGRTFEKFLEPLYLLQKRAVRLCCGAPFRAHTTKLFSKLKFLKLRDILFHNTLLLMFKLKNHMFPTTFSNYFLFNSDVHSINTRRKNDYHLPKFTNAFLFDKSIRYQGPVKWNALSNELKNEGGFGVFKNQTKKKILATYTSKASK